MSRTHARQAPDRDVPRPRVFEDDDLALIRRRLRAFFSVFCVLAWLGLGAHLAITTIAPSAMSAHPTFVLLSFVFGALTTTLFYLSARLPLPRPALHALDATFVGFATVAPAALMVIPTGRQAHWRHPLHCE